MAHVVCESCINCTDTACVAVCPVDCFRVGPNFLVIDPDECIDCAVCVPECPEEAIFHEDDVPAGQEEFIALNAELCQNGPLSPANVLAPQMLTNGMELKVSVSS